MTLCKEIKVKQGEDRQIAVSLCTENPDARAKYRWNDVTCPKCRRMGAGLAEERHKQQMKLWKEENE